MYVVLLKEDHEGFGLFHSPQFNLGFIEIQTL